MILLNLPGIAAEKLSLTPAMKAYIQTISQQYHFDQDKLEKLFENVTLNKKLLNYFHHAYEKKPWYQYRHLFVDNKRIDNGVAFWQKNHKTLEKAEKIYHIPPSIIVAIIGIETRYGKRQGEFSVLNTLTTLAFYYPEREKFFRHELTNYLLMTREQQLDPQSIKGSYAGAIGIPQFMPSTYRHYAIDNAQKSHADLANDADDAIMSIGNYLQKMGWQAKQALSVKLTTSYLSPKLLSPSAKPDRTLASLLKQGIDVPSSDNSQRKAALIRLQTRVASYGYWLTFHNFSVIMRYNTNVNYAMAVDQLSEAINHEYQHKTTATRANPASTRKN